MSVLGDVVHAVTARSGASASPLVSNWSAHESAGAGFLGASGVIGTEHYLANPDVYADRSTWRTYHRQSGELLWAGELAEPSSEGGVVKVLGRGWGELYPERELGAVLCEVNGVGLFEPFPGSYSSENSWESAAIGNGEIEFRRQLNAGANSGGWATVTAIAEVDVEFYRLRFHLDPGFGTGKSRLIVNNGNDVMYDATFTGTDADLDVDINLVRDISPTDIAPKNFLRIQISNTTTDWTLGLRLVLSNVVISGIPGGGDLSDGGLVRDVADRIGIPATIDERGVSVLPYYPGACTAGELLDRAMLFSGYVARFVDHGAGAVLDYGPWGTTRWQVTDQRQPMVVHELDRYDKVLLSGKDHTNTPTTLTVELVPSPLERSRTYGPIEVPERLLTHEAQEVFLDHLLSIVSKRRHRGDGQLVEVTDAGGIARSAQLVHAGDVIYHPASGGDLKVQELRRTDAGIYPSFGDEIESVLERLFARERRRFRLQR